MFFRSDRYCKIFNFHSKVLVLFIYYLLVFMQQDCYCKI